MATAVFCAAALPTEPVNKVLYRATQNHTRQGTTRKFGGTTVVSTHQRPAVKAAVSCDVQRTQGTSPTRKWYALISSRAANSSTPHWNASAQREEEPQSANSAKHMTAARKGTRAKDSETLGRIARCTLWKTAEVRCDGWIGKLAGTEVIG
ncbi:hypothetical protein MRX96_019725 [Rhipicephalus microplus]